MTAEEKKRIKEGKKLLKKKEKEAKKAEKEAKKAEKARLKAEKKAMREAKKKGIPYTPQPATVVLDDKPAPLPEMSPVVAGDDKPAVTEENVGAEKTVAGKEETTAIAKAEEKQVAVADENAVGKDESTESKESETVLDGELDEDAGEYVEAVEVEKKKRAPKKAAAKKSDDAATDKKAAAKPGEKKTKPAVKKEKTEEKPADTETATTAETAEPLVDSEAKPEKQRAKNYHISLRKEDGKWQVKLGRGEKALKLFDTQAEAIAYAKERAKNQEGSITIHKVDGKIRKQKY